MIYMGICDIGNISEFSVLFLLNLPDLSFSLRITRATTSKSRDRVMRTHVSPVNMSR